MRNEKKTDGVPQSLADMGSILDGSVAVPRENKLLARKTVADRAHGVKDCQELLEALGLLDLDTIQEPA